MIIRHLFRDTPDYPERLLALPRPPAVIATTGELDATCAVAIVGTREPDAEAEAFASELAGAVVREGGVVVSGGAIGIDAAAHRGALAAGGRTWAVTPTGREHVFPSTHGELYRLIGASEGAMVWPFADDQDVHLPSFFVRNGVLVALAHVVVVVQAGIPSGALNAAKWARELGRPLWVVPAVPWLKGFEGCASELARGARPLGHVGEFLKAIGLGPRARPVRKTTARPAPPAGVTPDEKSLVSVLGPCPLHADVLAAKAGLSAQAASTALLTLALENVVVEGPAGFFRRVL